MRKSETASLADLLVQAKITNRLLAAQLRGQMNQQDLISLLYSTDATNKEIAEILDTTAGTVKTAVARLRKRTDAQKGGSNE